jgi:hypothetical protein
MERTEGEPAVKLRDVAGPLEAALTRLREKPEARRPTVVVDAERPGASVFIQYYGSAERKLVLEVCLNAVTRYIDGFEPAAKEYFGGEARIDESETFGVWDKECESVTQAVERGMHVLRHVLMLDWDAELFIEESEDRTFSRAALFGRGES